jgi:hypothetical protein
MRTRNWTSAKPGGSVEHCHTLLLKIQSNISSHLRLGLLSFGFQPKLCVQLIGYSTPACYMSRLNNSPRCGHRNVML